MLTAPAAGIGGGHARWRRAAPRPVITCQSPEVAGLSLTFPRVEDRRTCFLHEQLGGPLQVSHQRVMHGAKFEVGAPDPIDQGGPVEIDALAAVGLRLAIERQVFGILADQHMRDQILGRQAAPDQPRWCRCLNHAEDAELGQDDVEPIRDVFPDAMQTATAGTGQAVGFDHLLEAQQVFRKRSAIGGTRLRRALCRAIVGILFGVNHRYGRFQVIQRQFELVRCALLRPPFEGRLPEGRNQLVQPFYPLVLAKVARLRGDQHRRQRRSFAKQISGIRHEGILSDPPRRYPKKVPSESSCRSLERLTPLLPGPALRWPEPAANPIRQTAPRSARGSPASARPSPRAR